MLPWLALEDAVGPTTAPRTKGSGVTLSRWAFGQCLTYLTFDTASGFGLVFTSTLLQVFSQMSFEAVLDVVMQGKKKASARQNSSLRNKCSCSV